MHGPGLFLLFYAEYYCCCCNCGGGRKRRRWRPSLSHGSGRGEKEQIIKMYFQFVVRNDCFFVVSVSRDRCQTKRATHQLLARLSHCKYDFDCLDFSLRLFWFFAQIEKNSNGRFRGVVNSFGEIPAMLSNSTNAMQSNEWSHSPDFYSTREWAGPTKAREMRIGDLLTPEYGYGWLNVRQMSMRSKGI